MLSLTAIALATFCAPSMLYRIRFANDPYQLAAHYLLGRLQSALILLWVIVFIASLIHHQKRALWGLLLVPVLLFAYVVWGFWTTQ